MPAWELSSSPQMSPSMNLHRRRLRHQKGSEKNRVLPRLLRRLPLRRQGSAAGPPIHSRGVAQRKKKRHLIWLIRKPVSSFPTPGNEAPFRAMPDSGSRGANEGPSGLGFERKPLKSLHCGHEKFCFAPDLVFVARDLFSLRPAWGLSLRPQIFCAHPR